MPPGVQTSMDSPAPALPDTQTASAASRPVPSTIARADVERVVDRGFGRFLGHLDVQASVTAGKFTGWTIVALQPPELWSDVDLRPGDVVTRVNGMPIEREMQAYEAFQAVRSADKLEVAYLRHGQPRTLSYLIIGKPSPALPAAQPPPSPSPSPSPSSPKQSGN
jgi:S1-C subfamily serine protease